MKGSWNEALVDARAEGWGDGYDKGWEDGHAAAREEAERQGVAIPRRETRVFPPAEDEDDECCDQPGDRFCTRDLPPATDQGGTDA